MSTMQPKRLTAVTNELNTVYSLNVTETTVADYLATLGGNGDIYHQKWCNRAKVATIANTIANSAWGMYSIRTGEVVSQ